MLSEKELKKYGIEKYTILEDGSVHAHQNVDLSNKNLTKIPFDFYQVDGDFYCFNNKLTSLKGCPQKVGGGFYCNNNQLSSLKHCPETINGDFYCSENQLTSLEFYPQKVGGSFFCHHNKISSLKSYNGKVYCWSPNPINLKELIELVKNDKDENWKNLTQVQDTSSKEIVLEQLHSKLEILEAIQ